MDTINFFIFNEINRGSGSNQILDSVIAFIAEYLPLLFIAYLIYLWRSNNRSGRMIACYAFCALIFGFCGNLVTGLVYFHPRPFMVPIGKAILFHKPETSFPSNHTTIMLSISLMLVYFRETRTAGAILTLWGIIGGVARVYCGVHFPFDILGSFGVGLLASSLVYRLGKTLPFMKRQSEHRILA